METPVLEPVQQESSPQETIVNNVMTSVEHAPMIKTVQHAPMACSSSTATVLRPAQMATSQTVMLSVNHATQPVLNAQDQQSHNVLAVLTGTSSREPPVRLDATMESTWIMAHANPVPLHAEHAHQILYALHVQLVLS